MHAMFGRDRGCSTFVEITCQKAQFSSDSRLWLCCMMSHGCTNAESVHVMRPPVSFRLKACAFYRSHI
eukprot:6106170-Pleurochrysis_carterae.AAC.2